MLENHQASLCMDAKETLKYLMLGRKITVFPFAYMMFVLYLVVHITPPITLMQPKYNME